ncbi:hypothetical protein I7I51_02174 [Histoplasma capsulatum]|uniref:PiggyBac transposable element-derived protein domain-containing protein n=1 Tax=Ajellomyces capsulatus TaxID=5037 RepID=A0A8A1ME68_AJECA|nr:hypothetical protein I7I51_02174 [Histoplasma capsulatum]
MTAAASHFEAWRDAQWGEKERKTWRNESEVQKKKRKKRYAPTGVRAVVAADRRAMPLDPSLGPMRKTSERADSPKLGVGFTNSCESMDLLVFVDDIGYPFVAHTKTPKKRKRPIEKVIAEIPSLESVKFLPMQATSQGPVLNLSIDINIESPYALFTLFFSEECFQQISNSTNLYAKLKKEDGDTDNEAPELSGVEMEIETEKIIVETSSISTSIIQPREWKKINPAEIKVFIDLLLYMEVHKSQRTDLYWRNDLKQGSIHSIQSYMSHTRFQQLK